MSYPFCALFSGQIPLRLAKQPIGILDDQYEEVAEFLHGYSDVHASLEQLSNSKELVVWLRTVMKGKLNYKVLLIV